MFANHLVISEHNFQLFLITEAHHSLTNVEKDYYVAYFSVKTGLFLLEKFVRGVQTLCVALRIVCNSSVHSNVLINYAIAIHLFRIVLRNNLKNFSSNNSC